jgi:hypothetical protein
VFSSPLSVSVKAAASQARKVVSEQFEITEDGVQYNLKLEGTSGNNWVKQTQHQLDLHLHLVSRVVLGAGECCYHHMIILRSPSQAMYSIQFCSALSRSLFIYRLIVDNTYRVCYVLQTLVELAVQLVSLQGACWGEQTIL